MPGRMHWTEAFTTKLSETVKLVRVVSYVMTKGTCMQLSMGFAVPYEQYLSMYVVCHALVSGCQGVFAVVECLHYNITAFDAGAAVICACCKPAHNHWHACRQTGR